MLRGFRNSIKRLPVLGPALHHIYLKLFKGEGRVESIRSGRLQGTQLHRYNRSTHDRHFQGDYETETQQALAENLKEGQTFYDVGANAGFISLLAAKLVGPKGHVVSFEPSRLTARELQSQLDLNRVSWARVITKACSDRTGTAELSDDTSSDMLALAEVRSNRPQKTVTVETVTLDELIQTLPHPNLVKIDVEGAEMLVLAGAKQLLKNVRPTLLVELHNPSLSAHFHELAKSVSYDIFDRTGKPVPDGYYERFVIARPRGAGAA